MLVIGVVGITVLLFSTKYYHSEEDITKQNYLISNVTFKMPKELFKFDDAPLPMDVMEQDSAETEDVQNLMDYVLPGGHLPTHYQQFGFQINRKVFEGWVKQPSPCCGAAAVAGAWNALLSLHRHNPKAINHKSVLEIYKNIFEHMIEKKKLAFERKLGAAIDDLLTDLVERLNSAGKKLGGAKGEGATKAAVMKCLRDMAKNFALSKQKDQDTSKSNKSAEVSVENADMKCLVENRSSMDCILELFELDGIVFTEEEEAPDESAADQQESEVIPSKSKLSIQQMITKQQPD